MYDINKDLVYNISIGDENLPSLTTVEMCALLNKEGYIARISEISETIMNKIDPEKKLNPCTNFVVVYNYDMSDTVAVVNFDVKCDRNGILVLQSYDATMEVEVEKFILTIRKSKVIHMINRRIKKNRNK